VFLSVNTVKWHIRRILEKLEARNRNEAVFIARQLGLIEA
jgi:LuxR family maltose regulon positive regulatory protein